MAAPNSGSGYIYGPGLTVTISSGAVPTSYGGGVVGTTGVVSFPVDIQQMMMVSFQTELWSAAATVTVDIQVTNVPESRTGYKAPGGSSPGIPVYRDDSYASNDWITVSSNLMAAATTARMDVLAYTPHRAARVRLTGNLSPTTLAYVYYRNQGWGS